MASETFNSWSDLAYDKIGAISAATANARFNALYEERRITELQDEIQDMAPKWLTKRPPGTTPAVFEYATPMPLSDRDCITVEAGYNGIHGVLLDVEQRTGAKIHYYYKATSRPTRDTEFEPFAQNAPAAFVSILVDFSVKVTVDKGLLGHILTQLYRVPEITTGYWSCKQVPPTENATIWRLNWFKRHVEGASWPFYLGGYQHRRFEVNNDTRKFRSDHEVEQLDEAKQKEQDRKMLSAAMGEDPMLRRTTENPPFWGLCDPYYLQGFPGKEFYGP